MSVEVWMEVVATAMEIASFFLATLDLYRCFRLDEFT
jgi:hypothetical protein